MKDKNKRFIKISYDLDGQMPVFVNNPPNQLEMIDSFEKGDAWNSCRLMLFNHNGTHIDAPNHFDAEGKKICDYRIEDFVFEKPCLVDIPKKESEQIIPDDLMGIKGESLNCDILLLRTGFYKRRNRVAYVKKNPWLNPSAAHFIRHKFKRLKALGIDLISISSFTNIKEGGRSHQVLLKRGDYSSSPVMIIEDLNLGLVPDRIKRLFAIPLFAREADSMPCTVFIEVKA